MKIVCRNFLFAVGVVTVCAFFTPLGAQQITTFILVRHAEKMADETKDPVLSAEGQARALRLRHVLGKTALDAIYTTPYKRTQMTVEPLAREKGIAVRNYEPSRPEVIDQMRTAHAGKTVLIAGHSNTIPEIANWLTSSTQFAAFEETDYDNLLIISIAGNSPGRVTWLRY